MLFALNSPAQERNRISGTVINATTHQPIASASIFISGTTSGTMSNASGHFVLNNVPAKGSFELVISSIGFNTYVHPYNADTLPLTLRLNMTPKATELESVVVEPWEKDGWAKWGKLFTESFVGTVAASKNCEIKNKKALRFRFSRKTNVLIAVADEPLIIENKALGYRIKYTLEDYICNMKERTLLYVGYTLFEDMVEAGEKVPRRLASNRKHAYNGSIMHFMRSLYNNTLAQDGFEVQRLIKEPNLEKERVKKEYQSLWRRNIGTGSRMIMRPGDGIRIVSDSSAYYSSILRQEDFINVINPVLLTADSLMFQRDSSILMYFANYLYVTYKKGEEEQEFLTRTADVRQPGHQRSELVLLQGNPILVESSGTYYPPQELFALGYWAWSEKIAHLLPVEYNPEQNR